MGLAVLAPDVPGTPPPNEKPEDGAVVEVPVAGAAGVVVEDDPKENAFVAAGAGFAVDGAAVLLFPNETPGVAVVDAGLLPAAVPGAGVFAGVDPKLKDGAAAVGALVVVVLLLLLAEVLEAPKVNPAAEALAGAPLLLVAGGFPPPEGAGAPKENAMIKYEKYGACGASDFSQSQKDRAVFRRALLDGQSAKVLWIVRFTPRPIQSGKQCRRRTKPYPTKIERIADKRNKRLGDLPTKVQTESID